MTMKINPTTGMAIPSTSPGVRSGGGNFALSSSGQTQKSAGPTEAASASGLFGMDALLALQGEEDVLVGRRRRQIKRSTHILDALDDLRVSVLSGEIDDEALLRLQSNIAASREEVEDDRLQGVLNEIETRACVELAKRRLM